MTSAIGMAKGMNDVQAWIHDVVQDDGEADHALSFSADSFPLQGVGGFRSLRARPLYTAAPSEILLAYENMIADHAALQQQLAAAREECERLRQAVMYQEGRASEFVVRAAAAEADARAWRWYRDECSVCLDEMESAEKQAQFDATLQRDRQP